MKIPRATFLAACAAANVTVSPAFLEDYIDLDTLPSPLRDAVLGNTQESQDALEAAANKRARKALRFQELADRLKRKLQ